MKEYIKHKMLKTVVLYVCLILTLKTSILITLHFFHQEKAFDFYELPDISLIFTGVFFVMSIMLAGVMGDYKESEKLISEVTSLFETINDWVILAERVYTEKAVNFLHLKKEIYEVSLNYKNWLKSEEKDSKYIYPQIKRLNEIGYILAENNCDKEAIKYIQDASHQIRNKTTRIYNIVRTNFVKSGYILLRSLLFLTIPLLLFARYKNLVAGYLVTFIVSFILIYLYKFIQSLDNPFNYNQKLNKIDLLSLNRLIERMKQQVS